MAVQKGADVVKRGEGPMALWFLDHEKKTHKRVPLTGTGIVITPKGGAAKEYKLSDLPDSVKTALLLAGAAQRLKSYIVNHGDPSGSDAIELADSVWSDLVEGKVYAKNAVDGAPKGRKFDATLYCDAWKAAMAFMASKGMTRKSDGVALKPMTDAQYEDMKNKLETMPIKSETEVLPDGTVKVIKMGRNDWLASFKKNEFYNRALADLKAKQIKPDTKTKEVDVMPF